MDGAGDGRPDREAATVDAGDEKQDATTDEGTSLASDSARTDAAPFETGPRTLEAGSLAADAAVAGDSASVSLDAEAREAHANGAPDVGTADAPLADRDAADRAADSSVDAGANFDASAVPVVATDAPGSGSTAPGDRPRGVRLSETDKLPDVELTADGLSMSVLSLGREGVRSETAIPPSSGMFYFEGQELVDAPWINFGVITRGAPLDTGSVDPSQGFVIDSGDGSYFDRAATSHYGFIVDYRSAHPTVHLIATRWDGTGIVFSTALSRISEPLYIYVGGLRRNTGPQASINAGNDVVNFPFFYDPVAALSRAGIAGGEQLVRGFGASYVGPFDQPPTIQVGADVSLPLGTAVTLTAAASDPEEGDLTSRIAWSDEATPVATRVSGTGGRFTFTPNALGVHPVTALATDRSGKTASQTVRVTVTGALPVYDPVRLVVDAFTGDGIVLTADGLGAHFTSNAKMAIRANQGLYQGFQYFEFHRELAPVNIGGGVVIGDGDLNPYGPRDIPPSCSVNVLGSTWRELMFQSDYTTAGYDPAKESYYGFAVDYRRTSPTVYVIIASKVVNTVLLPDATVPLYPMLYGYPVTSGAAPDETINFGVTAFHYDARAILGAAGIDLTGFQLGWGKNAR